MLAVCNNLSAALSYYYLLSNLITMLQTFIIQKFFVNEEKLYKVERILDCKLSRNGRRFYLVKWAGWPIKYCTW